MSGKPLKYDYAGLRSLRIPPFRIIYEFNEKEKTIILHKFEHRERAYK
jgi:mRNA-degrading endonuclease RelE of RelBE toxin-antitoxin system